MSRTDALIGSLLTETVAQNHPTSYLNLNEAAAILRVSTKTVTAELKAGNIPGRKIGREWRIKQEDL